jgi:hypothetical protein
LPWGQSNEFLVLDLVRSPLPEETLTLFETLAAHFTVHTSVRNLLDAHPVADLDRRVRGMLANSHDLADTLVSADERRVGGGGPILELRMKIYEL